MYRAEPDPYCYPGISVLINLLDIGDQTVLDAFEAEITSQRATEPLPRGRFGYRHYCSIHRHLFQDVYAWAGKIRTVRMSKEGSNFCYPENIDREMRRLFADLAQRRYLRRLEARAFAKSAAHFLAELNAIHPFREGNGRAQLTFLTILADHAAHPLKLGRLVPSAVLAATISSFKGDEAPLVAVIADLVR